MATSHEDILKAIADMETGIGGRLDAHDDVLRTMSTQVLELTAAKATGSLRAKALSDADLTQQAKLAEEILARQEVQKKVDELTASNVVQLAILQRLDGVAKNPTIKVLLAVAGIAATSWMAARGLK